MIILPRRMLLPFGVVAVNNLDQDHSDNDDNDEEEEDDIFDPAERERICMESMFILHYRLDFSVKNIRIPFAKFEQFFHENFRRLFTQPGHGPPRTCSFAYDTGRGTVVVVVLLCLGNSIVLPHH